MKAPLSLSPLVLFVALYLGVSLVAGDFYAMPVSVAFTLSAIYAIALAHGSPLRERIAVFSRGAGTEGIMQMLWIFVLAGAFAATAKQLGSIDATVNLMLRLLPSNMLLAGLFLATCVVSLSVGTSVGTIVALVPIAVGLADSTGASVPLLVAVVVGGAFFGDNLSFISDTTIAATQSQGCQMSDKFRANVFIALPAALVSLALYTFMGWDMSAPVSLPPADYVKTLPYLAVLVLAFVGLNVLAVLTIGIVITAVIGFLTGAFNLSGWCGAMGSGIVGMGELIIVTMLAGGLFEVIRWQGGIDYIINRITRRIHGRRGAEAVIALLVALVDVCTANNTVALITVGGIARRIADTYGVDHRRAASLLDTAACIMQGVIPYGAQMLMAAALASQAQGAPLSPVAVMPYLYYPFVLAATLALAILLRRPRRYAL